METLLAAEAALDNWKSFTENIHDQIHELNNLLEEKKLLKEYLSTPDVENELLSVPNHANTLLVQIQGNISNILQEISKLEQNIRNSYKFPLSIASANIPVNDMINSKIHEVLQDVIRVLLLRSSTFNSSLNFEDPNLIEDSLEIDLEEERCLRLSINKLKLSLEILN